jgi:hypothetical protein
MIPIPITWYVIGAMALALGGTGWLLYDSIEDKGRFLGWVIDLRAAGEDCRAKIAAIRSRQIP